ncbi:MAG: tetratricopeptide repeat protein [Syntrophobacteraceae bacterium]|jgi:tetratricopeptide (TPR) repeat protein
MGIPDFYAHLIELASPWTVKAVVAKEGSEIVEVHLECAQTARLTCPRCDLSCPVCGFSPPKTWRHLDTCGKMTWLHAGLPIVDCPEHGKQQLSAPWAHEDSPATLAFERWIARLSEGFGDLKKAAHFAGVEYALIRRILRRAACGEPPLAGMAKPKTPLSSTAAGAKPESRPPAAPQPQLNLFAQNDMSLVNRGIRAFKNLELEKAVELFEKHRSVYPKDYDISSRLAAAEFLLRGIGEAPHEPGKRPGYLCRLWDSFEDFIGAAGIGRDAFGAEIKTAFFARVIEEAEECGPVEGPSFLPGDIPLGYVLLQAGRYEEAIRSLQDYIPKMPHNAALYGYLGDAYRLRGDYEVARRCYREACLIDPAAIDWRHLHDEDLRELKQDLLLEYGFDPELAQAWLPSHARIDGLFERKVVRIHDGLKEMVDDYLALEKALSKEKSPLLSAKLFFRGMVLCENRENLKFIKTIDLMQVRRIMKQANPDLFEEFLERIVEDKG